MAATTRPDLPILAAWHDEHNSKRPLRCGVMGCRALLELGVRRACRCSGAACRRKRCRLVVKPYHIKHRLCPAHIKCPAVLRQGMPQRWCAQCGAFHVLDAFVGDKRSCAVKLKAHNARRARPRGAAAIAPPPPPPQAISRKRAADAAPLSADRRTAKRARTANPARTPGGMHEASGAPHVAATDGAALAHLPPLLRFRAGPRRTRAERKPVSPSADAAEALLRLGGPSSGLAWGSPAASPSSGSPASGIATPSTETDSRDGSPVGGASFAWGGAATVAPVVSGIPGSASPTPAAGWGPAWAVHTLEALLGGGCTGAGDPPDWVPAAVAAARGGGEDLDLLCGADAVALQLELLSEPGAAAEAPPCVLHFEAW